MSEPDYLEDLELARRLADAARLAIAPFFRADPDVENKLDAGFDPVTAADRASERAMRDLLDRERPDDGVIGEEFGRKASSSGRTWVLDPIDGTRAFIAGLPGWTVLIACSGAHGPEIGVVDQPFTGERYCGSPGGSVLEHGSNRRQLTTSSRTTLDQSILMSTDPYLFVGDEAAAFDALRQRVRLCRFGFDAYAYAMLAAGTVDLVVESGLQIYDVQALIPVVQGAGGVVTNWRGGAAHDGGQVLAAANRDLHAAALELLAEAAN
jgi:histidinol phosphatase-like enzyme (inositol monophosphatase family)